MPATSSSKNEQAKSFLKNKVDRAKAANQKVASSKNEEGTTKKIVEANAPVKEKKEAVLADARKKMGISEEKREKFKERSAEAKIKRQQKTQTEKTTSTTSTTTPATDSQPPELFGYGKDAPAGDPTLGHLRREDMDPNRSVMAQRVERQMEKTGMTREDAKSAVLARREERQGQIADVRKEYSVGEQRARNIVQYANRNKVAGAEDGPAVANYQLAKRVVEMSRNKGLTRKEAAGVIASRQENRKKSAETTPPAA
jgi:hypothetical protein